MRSCRPRYGLVALLALPCLAGLTLLIHMGHNMQDINCSAWVPYPRYKRNASGHASELARASQRFPPKAQAPATAKTPESGCDGREQGCLTAYLVHASFFFTRSRWRAMNSQNGQNTHQQIASVADSWNGSPSPPFKSMDCQRWTAEKPRDSGTALCCGDQSYSTSKACRFERRASS